ncbi:MAG: hypothetical protein LQ339_008607 [Xanthoria mediterranea]|nr:MAG: hypothetical protein LQ339_008607 [Xanthoria mediterranea]
MSYTGTGPDHAREALIRANERTADKYDVPDLRQIALQTFTHWCEKLSSRPQAEEAAEYLDLFLYAVYTVYECLPELDGSLRKPLTKALARFLNASPALINLEEYRDRCLEYPLFGLDMQKESLLLTHAGEPGWEIEEE